MKVAITGASGHLGGMIVRELLSREHTVKALVRKIEERPFKNIVIDFVIGDLNDESALRLLIESCDAVIHCAAIISIDGGMNGQVHQTNVEGTRKVMEAAKAKGVRRVIHISSIQAYQQHPIDQPLDETRAKATPDAFAYDRSKKEGQELALSYANEMDVLVMNPTTIIGPYDFKPSKLGKAIINMISDKLPFVFTGGIDYCDSRDVAKAIVNSLTHGRNGEAYLLSGGWCSLKEFARTLGNVSGKNLNPIALPYLFSWMGLPIISAMAWLTKQDPLYTNEALIAVRDCNRHISNVKAKAELNYSTRPLKETLTDTYAWFKENGYLG